MFQDWSGLDLRWGQGYPAVDVRFDSDEAIGGQRQTIWDNEIVRGSNMNDQPEFITNYTSNLRVNALVADFGQVKITYDLAFATQLLDLMVLDVDEEDHVRIECRNPDGSPIDPRLLQRVVQGDLSRSFNAAGRPASEAVRTNYAARSPERRDVVPSGPGNRTARTCRLPDRRLRERRDSAASGRSPARRA